MSSSQLAVYPDEIEFRRSWKRVSEIEWILLAALPTPEIRQSVSEQGFPIGFDLWHDPVPTDLADQLDLMRAVQPERDEALATAETMCDFGPALLGAGDDLALLERLSTLSTD